MQQSAERLGSLDATFLELEQHEEGATMHIGGALIFEPLPETSGPPSLDALLELLHERLGRVPRFRMRLSEERVHGLQRPAWVVDPAFDLRAHVRHAALPSPGDDAEVDEWLADFWSHRLDRSRPLWEMTLVDGLRDGRWMLATKTHHAMVDGVGSVDIGHILLDAEPHPAPRKALEDSGSNGAADRGSRLPGWLPSALSAAHDVLDATVGTVLHPRRLLKAGQATAAMGEVVWKDEVLGARPSTMNVPIGSTRRFVSVPFELSQVKQVRQGLGGTVNDVVLAICAGALRALLEGRGEQLDRPLRAMVPVNLRGDDHGSLGNKVSSLFVELPIGESDRRRRYEATRAAAGELKSGSAALGASTIISVSGVLPPVVHGSIADMLYSTRLCNLTITNVPGPQIPLFALGSQLRRILPLVPLFKDHSVGVAIVSYDGELVFGVNVDRASNPDLVVLERGLREEFAALLALANV
jgi:diacylglycerol O-acyltransferase / wax synthase